MSIFKINEYKSKISALEREKESLEQMLSELQKQTQEKLSRMDWRLKQLEEDLKIKDSLIKDNMPFWKRDFSPIHDQLSHYQQMWAKWPSSLHYEEPQILRQQRAASKVYSPLSIEINYGVFHGYERDYTTTLVNCECVDYQRRQLPCKHMYRLAHEIDVFMLDNVEYVPDPHQLMRISDIKDKLSPMTRAQLEYFCGLLRQRYILDSASCLTLKYLLNNNLAVIYNNPEKLLEFFTKDDLFSRLPADAKIKKSIKKQDLIRLICDAYPNVIESINTAYTQITINPYYEHILDQVKNFVYQQL